jgi:uncharacterized protein (TIRG00374 family)
MMKRRYWALGSLGLVLSLGIPLLIGRGDALHLLKEMPLAFWLAALAIIALSWNVNAGRVRMLLSGLGRPMRQLTAVALIMASEFAICASPAGAGGPVTYVVLLKRHGLSAAQGMAIYAVDQLMDLLFFVTTLSALGVYWLLVPARAQAYAPSQLLPLFALLGVGLVAVLLLVRFHRGVMLALLRVLRKLHVSHRRRRRVARWYAEFRGGLVMVGGFPPTRLLAIYALCATHWLLRYSVLYVVLRGLGVHVTWVYSFLVQTLALTVGQFTLLPGGSGGAELSATALLTPEVGAATAAAAIIAWRFATYYWYLIAGAPVFLVQAGRLRSDRARAAQELHAATPRD